MNAFARFVTRGESQTPQVETLATPNLTGFRLTREIEPVFGGVIIRTTRLSDGVSFWELEAHIKRGVADIAAKIDDGAASRLLQMHLADGATEIAPDYRKAARKSRRKS